jgi:SPASM domain peptide maturase of grasp-with-spasm system
MLQMNKKFFVLYPSCIIVDGRKNNAIYDLQRNEVYSVPLYFISLFSVDSNYGTKYINIEKFKKTEIKNVLKILSQKDIGYFCNELPPFCQINTNHFGFGNTISNFLIDINNNSSYSLKKVNDCINDLFCESLEIRYFGDVNTNKVISDLAYFSDSTLRSITLSLGLKEDVEDFVSTIMETNERVFKIQLFEQKTNEVKRIYDLFLIYNTNKLLDEFSCGNCTEYNILAQTQFYIESLHYNNCLYKKVAIDKNGFVKNCPALQEHFGHISEISDIKSVVQSQNFQYLWNLKKDLIDECKECALRYACHDCRAILKEPDNVLSRPLKCFLSN